MIIEGFLIWKENKIKLIWHDSDNFGNLPKDKLQQAYGVCFCNGKLLLVKGSIGWSIVGGRIEKGETPEDALAREVQEETNMRVLKQIPIGYQEVLNQDGTIDLQLRSFCLVEPIGKFEKDPGGSVTEIKLIDPNDYKKYFDWGKIGDRIMERALKIFEVKQNSTN